MLLPALPKASVCPGEGEPLGTILLKLGQIYREQPCRARRDLGHDFTGAEVPTGSLLIIVSNFQEGGQVWEEAW